MMQGDANESGKASASKVGVIVRVRPPLQSEVHHEHCIRVRGRQVTLNTSLPETSQAGHKSAHQRRSRQIECDFDHVLDVSSTQENVWQLVKPKVDKVVQGFNATIFTYGMTGSGKTYSMLGPEMMALAREDAVFPNIAALQFQPSSGLLPRAVARLLDATTHDLKGGRSKLTLSYLQIYQEKCYDLLTPPGLQQPLRVREDSSRTGAVFVEGITEATVSTLEACFAKLLFGFSNIAYRSTVHNEQSSRSHVILTLTLHSTSGPGIGRARISKLHLVDLAGNERWSSFGPSMSPMHAKELTSINQSLHVLGNCIEALSKPAGRAGNHVPYRSSVLTMLLRESLAGNSLILMLCTVCGCALYQMQSLCTLRFADRAKRVRLQVQQTIEVRDEKALLEKTQAEVVYWRSLVAENAGDGRLQEKMEKLESDNAKLEDENKQLKRKVVSLSASQQLSAKLAATGNMKLLASRPLQRARACSEPALPTQQLLSSSLADTDPAVPATPSFARQASQPAKARAMGQSTKRDSIPAKATSTSAPYTEQEDRSASVMVSTTATATSEMQWQAGGRIWPESRQPAADRRGGQATQAVLAVPDKEIAAANPCSTARHHRTEDPCNPRCPEGHSLVCLGSSSQPVAAAAYAEWHCDTPGCNSNSIRTPCVIRFHCAACQYDLCGECLKTWVAASASSQAPSARQGRAQTARPAPVGPPSDIGSVYAEPSRPRESLRRGSSREGHHKAPAAVPPGPSRACAPSEPPPQNKPRRRLRQSVGAGGARASKPAAPSLGSARFARKADEQQQKLLMDYYKRKFRASPAEGSALQQCGSPDHELPPGALSVEESPRRACDVSPRGPWSKGSTMAPSPQSPATWSSDDQQTVFLEARSGGASAEERCSLNQQHGDDIGRIEALAASGGSWSLPPISSPQQHDQVVRRASGEGSGGGSAVPRRSAPQDPRLAAGLGFDSLLPAKGGIPAHEAPPIRSSKSFGYGRDGSPILLERSRRQSPRAKLTRLPQPGAWEGGAVVC